MLAPHIGIFGRRNYGKSSLLNYLTDQRISIVSDTPGTTTDPVRKSMELLGVGPVVWVDTAGVDDDQDELGRLRVLKTHEMLSQCDLVLIVVSNNRFDREDQALVEACLSRKTPFLLIYTRVDVSVPEAAFLADLRQRYGQEVIEVSVLDPRYRSPLCTAIREALPESSYVSKGLLDDVVSPGDTVVLVTPIDSSAPEGRMILPQVQVLRNLMDLHAMAYFCQPSELQRTLLSLQQPPRLVVTDSQAFAQVKQIVPESIPLTSFSVVLARAKGLFSDYVKGTPFISRLRDGDRVLILESCTHNVTCDDIGRVKLPKLLAKHTGRQLECEVVSGLTSLSRPITDYSMVIQCGGCVITHKQLVSRLMPAIVAGIPVSNYGLAIAYMTGIFERSMQVFAPTLQQQ